MAIALLAADALSIFGFFGQQQWGIFSSEGQPILVVDAVSSVEYSRDYHISDYPQERGGFQSYNKVKVPFQAKVAFLIGANRTEFLNQIEAAVGSLDLVSVVTPEIQYPSANLTHYSYRREARNGKTLIRVEVWCEEIRQAGPGTLSSSNTMASNSTGTAAGGAAAGQINQTGSQSTSAATPTDSGQTQPIQATPDPSVTANDIAAQQSLPGTVPSPESSAVPPYQVEPNVGATPVPIGSQSTVSPFNLPSLSDTTAIPP